ncbi:NUDIX domain-containing protein [Jannaschia sp. W003]|uniref:NUDIX domain-containing protein n=1 Tax=Jannaschia sp. W003 TaxID=2867012 RepID=UPI0021A823A8|nr:NUDIX domain-containing protein [Jannaschia sp. W003]UWQ20313.1 NUDIX domain-containing protein [Jannaschia sp. W003]
MRLALFGTLLWPELLDFVAGRPVRTVPATLEGRRVARAPDGDWPVLLRDPAARAACAVTEPLDAGALARIDWYEGGFGYDRERVTAQAADGPVEAEVYRGADGGGGPWSLDRWRREHGARTRLAAAEVMRAMGREDAASLAARRGVLQARASAQVAAAARARPATAGGELRRADLADLRAEPVHDGFISMETMRFRFPRFGGGLSDTVERDVVISPDAATLLPYDPRRDRVLLVEQVRAGAVALGDPQPWLLEPVAGIVDAGETAEAAAIRETWEEAGLRVAPDALHLVARYYPTPGFLAQVIWSYVARCDLPNDAGGLGGLASESEDIRVHVLSFDALMEMVRSGEAAAAPLILSAQWLARHRASLRA